MALEDLSNNNNSIKKKKYTRNKKSNERTTLKIKQILWNFVVLFVELLPN